MTQPIERIGVLGAGAWGAALAQAAARAGRDVVLWARRKEQAVGINARRENADHLPGVTLSESIRATSVLDELTSCDAIFAVTPAQHTREVLCRFRSASRPRMPVVMCSKGLEQSSLKLMTDVLVEELPDAIPAVLSGPNFAREVALGLPAATTLACNDFEVASRLAEAIGQPSFRPYLTDDLIGAEIAGAVKNVHAIACGIVAGRRLGLSAHASLITRAFAEMARLAGTLGARVETLQGLCGLGDLVLTCSSSESRNMSLGYSLGQGRKLDQVLAERRGVTEGVTSAPAVAELARRKGVDMPIAASVDAIVSGRLSIDDAIENLLNRPFKLETL